MLPENDDVQEETAAENTPEATSEEEDNAVETSGEELAASFESDPDDLDLDEDEETEVVSAEEADKAPDKQEAEEDSTKEAKAEEKTGEEAAEEEKSEAEAEKEKTPETAEASTAQKPDGEDKEAETPPPEQPTLEDIQKQFTEWRAESEKLLAEHHYSLSEEETQELEEAGVPEALIEKLPHWGARIYLDAVQAAMGQVTTHLPQLMQMVATRQEQIDREETEFFEAWPALKEHEDTVRRMAVAYRQANPNADKETFIREVGASASVSLKLPIPEAEEAAAAAAKEKETAQQEPFKPAAKGTPAGAPPKKPAGFDALDRELFEEGEEDAEFDN